MHSPLLVALLPPMPSVSAAGEIDLILRVKPARESVMPAAERDQHCCLWQQVVGRADFCGLLFAAKPVRSLSCLLLTSTALLPHSPPQDPQCSTREEIVDMPLLGELISAI